MTQLRRKLDEYFFGESIPNQLAWMYYGTGAVLIVLSAILFAVTA